MVSRFQDDILRAMYDAGPHSTPAKIYGALEARIGYHSFAKLFINLQRMSRSGIIDCHYDETLRWKNRPEKRGGYVYSLNERSRNLIFGAPIIPEPRWWQRLTKWFHAA